MEQDPDPGATARMLLRGVLLFIVIVALFVAYDGFGVGQDCTPAGPGAC